MSSLEWDPDKKNDAYESSESMISIDVAEDDHIFKTRPRSHTIGTLHSIEENSVQNLKAKIKELQTEIKDQRKRFWKTQDRNSQTHIQVKRRVSSDFSGVITKQKSDIKKLNKRINELQQNLATAQEASEREIEQMKNKFQLERNSFADKLTKLEEDIVTKKLAIESLEKALVAERGKNEELISSLALQRSHVHELENVLQMLRGTQVRLLSHVKILNLDQWVVRVEEVGSLRRCQFRVSSDWDISYLKNILRAVYFTNGGDQFELELYQGDPDNASPLTSLTSLVISSSCPYEGANKELLADANCSAADIYLPVADLSLKLIPKPKAEVSSPKTLSILPESSPESELPAQNPQQCCLIS